HEVLRYADDCRTRLSALGAADERAHELGQALPDARARLDAAAARLSELRREAAVRLEELVRAELPGLALAQASFTVDCQASVEDLEHGRDRVELRFSANAAAPAAPLGKASSGGELSRVMIAVTL